MILVGGIAAAYLSFTLWHAADRHERPRLGWGALAAFVIALLLCVRSEGWGIGPIAATVAFLTAASLIVVFRPLAPRAVWLAAASTPIFIVWGSSRVNAFGRWTATFIPTLPIAVFAAIVLARTLPLSVEARLAVGFITLIPLWVTGICSVCLFKSGARAWLSCLALGGLLALFALR